MLKSISHKADIMDCHSTLSEILNPLPIWTWGNNGFLSFPAYNLNHDPIAPYFGTLNSIICLLHMFPWTDLSMWFCLRAAYLQWWCAHENKSAAHISPSPLWTDLALCWEPCLLPQSSQDLECCDLFHAVTCHQQPTIALWVSQTLQNDQVHKISINPSKGPTVWMAHCPLKCTGVLWVFDRYQEKEKKIPSKLPL